MQLEVPARVMREPAPLWGSVLLPVGWRGQDACGIPAVGGWARGFVSRHRALGSPPRTSGFASAGLKLHVLSWGHWQGLEVVPLYVGSLSGLAVQHPAATHGMIWNESWVRLGSSGER